MAQTAFVSLAARVLAHAGAAPERRAVVSDAETVTYADLTRRAQQCAARLQAYGLSAGGDRRVAILASNCIDFVVVTLGCQFAGVAIAPISGMIAPDAQARLIDDANAVILFHDHEHAEQAEDVARLSRQGSALCRVLIGRAVSRTPENPYPYDGWCVGDVTRFQPVTIEPHWHSDLIYSSGTTGTPKGIVQDYATRSSGNISLAGLGVVDGAHVAQTVSLYSNYGLVSLYVTLWWAGTFFMSRKFSSANFVDLLEKERIDMAWLVPATLIRVLGHAALAARMQDRPCIKVCMGAPLGRDHKQAAITEWPGSFIEGYGQTETGVLTLLAAHAVAPSKLGSVGIVVPTANVRILDEQGQVLPIGAVGEIAAHTTTMMSGYHGRDDENATVYWHDDEGKRYIRTGDLGRLDAEGYLWLSDRKKDMIISGGFNIYPADIERVLQGHPAVLEVAVVGCTSMTWGETPVAFVSLRADGNVAEEELRTWVNSRLGRAQRVAAVKVLPALPSGTMGKVLKQTLRDGHALALGTLP